MAQAKQQHTVTRNGSVVTVQTGDVVVHMTLDTYQANMRRYGNPHGSKAELEHIQSLQSEIDADKECPVVLVDDGDELLLIDLDDAPTAETSGIDYHATEGSLLSSRRRPQGSQARKYTMLDSVVKK